MSFGYIGYLWTLCGCAILFVVGLGGAAVLYGWARRSRGAEPTTHVEPVEVPGPRDGGDAA